MSYGEDATELTRGLERLSCSRIRQEPSAGDVRAEKLTFRRAILRSRNPTANAGKFGGDGVDEYVAIRWLSGTLFR